MILFHRNTLIHLIFNINDAESQLYAYTKRSIHRVIKYKNNSCAQSALAQLIAHLNIPSFVDKSRQNYPYKHLLFIFLLISIYQLERKRTIEIFYISNQPYLADKLILQYMAAPA